MAKKKHPPVYASVFPCVFTRSKTDGSLGLRVTIRSGEFMEIPLFGQHRQYILDNFALSLADHQLLETYEDLSITPKQKQEL